MEGKDISTEKWRAYEWVMPETGKTTRYVIYLPVTLFVGNTTHRVVDHEGVVHCVPNVGYMGCVLTWESLDGEEAVAF